MAEIVEAIRSNAPMIAIVAVGFWRVLVALHSIDRRLVRVETKLNREDDET